MPETIDKKREIQRLLNTLDPERLSKEDFVNAFEQVVNLILQNEQKLKDAISRLEETYSYLTSKNREDYISGLNNLKSRVNDLFVKDQLEKMSDENRLKFSELQKDINSVLDRKLKNVDGNLKSNLSELNKSMSQVLSGKLKDVDSLIAKINESLNSDKLKTEEIEKVKNELERISSVLSNLPRGKAMGRAKVPMPRTVDLTSSQNGVARIFNIPPDTVRIHGGLSSQFPFAISSSDISRSGNQITLDTTIAPRESGQTLLIFTDALFYP